VNVEKKTSILKSPKLTNKIIHNNQRKDDFQENSIPFARKKSSPNRNSTKITFSELSNLIAEPTLIINQSGKVEAANNFLEESIGLSESALIGKHINQFDFLMPQSKELMIKNFEKRMKGLRINPYELEVTIKGEKRYFEVKGKKIKYCGKFVDFLVLHEVTKRKRSLKELQIECLENRHKLIRDQEELNLIINSSPIIIFYKNKEGEFQQVNTAFLESMQISKEKLLGRTVFDLYSKDIAQRMTNDDIEVIKSGSPKLGIIEQYESANGLRWVRTDKVPIFDNNNKTCGIIGFAQDITERRIVENALVESEEKYRTLFEENMDAIFVADTKTGIILDCNRAALEMTGRTKSELVGQHESVFTPKEELIGDHSPSFFEYLKDQSKILEDKIITKSGEIRNVAIKSRLINFGDSIILQGTFRDITEQKKMQEHLWDSEERFRAISNSVREAIILINNDGIIEFWNPAAEQMFTYSKEEAVGRKVHELLAPKSMSKDERVYLKNKFTEFHGTAEGLLIDTQIELIMQNKEGTKFPVEMSISPIVIGTRKHTVGVVRDITERKREEAISKKYSQKLAEDFKKRTIELEVANKNLLKMERLAVVGELAGMVGHDLRNPLAGIKNAVYFLKKKGMGISEDQFKFMLEIIEKEITHADKIIWDLLFYSKDLHLDLENTSIRMLFEDALAKANPSKEINVEFKNLVDLKLKIDPEKMLRVLINLIKNAADAMSHGGTLSFNWKPNGRNVEVTVSDTGCGIPDEVLSKLFSPLITTKAQGMGFGLAICKRIIEAHDGTIMVETKKNEGTKFTITLPKELDSLDKKIKLIADSPDLVFLKMKEAQTSKKNMQLIVK
jgi:PAS domain S-box-containing protein